VPLTIKQHTGIAEAEMVENSWQAQAIGCGQDALSY
jgi:hypothetical protein